MCIRDRCVRACVTLYKLWYLYGILVHTMKTNQMFSMDNPYYYFYLFIYFNIFTSSQTTKIQRDSRDSLTAIYKGRANSLKLCTNNSMYINLYQQLQIFLTWCSQFSKLQLLSQTPNRCKFSILTYAHVGKFPDFREFSIFIYFTPFNLM